MNHTWNHRTGMDRRKNSIAPLRYILFGGRRENIRRQSDSVLISIMDKYPNEILIYSLLIVILSILDGYLTVYLTAKGALLINPLMKGLLDTGPELYIFVKFMITFISIICLQIFHKLNIHFLNIKVEKLFPMIFLMYCLVNIWNLQLIHKLML